MTEQPAESGTGDGGRERPVTRRMTQRIRGVATAGVTKASAAKASAAKASAAKASAGTASVAMAVAFTATLLLACAPGGTPPESVVADSLRTLPRALSAAEQQAVASNQQFAVALLREAAQTRPGNVLLAPISVSYALGLTMNGAEQETLHQMMSTLEWGTAAQGDVNAAYRDLAALLPTLDPAVTITLANGVWLRSPLVARADFQRDAQTYFGAPVVSLATPQTMYDSVNAWGRRRTNGMIPIVLEGQPSNDLAMLLANATYFAAPWRELFDTGATRAQPFALEAGDSIMVSTMYRRGGLRTSTAAGVTAVELSYGNTAWSMLLLIPDTQTVTALARSLRADTFSALIEGLRARTDVPLYLPKFTLAGNLELSRELKAMGMTRAFSEGAQFGRLVDAPTQLQFVQHAVKVVVDERGTKAAAVTVGGVVVTSAPVPYRIDRPFLFFIRERLTGTVAFAGIVRDPR